MALTLNRLKELISYDKSTGLFTWNLGNARAKKGSIAGHLHKNGYLRITIDGKQYRAHRLAWFYMTGTMPEGIIDHVNTVKSDNRWNNLRIATSTENSLNRSISIRNTSGIKGVHWSKEKNKWLVQITVSGMKFQLGGFKDIELANLVIEDARTKYHGEFSNTGR
ncbi:HNH endonuclease [Salmonella enterica]|nr:HNH endonuclease [Salmonella enterica]